MKKVLVLEDESSIRSFIVINLRRAGYEVIEAGTGEEALEMLQQHSDIRVALLDVMLPGIDGFEVCRRIRATNSRIGIIMLTARSQEMDKVTGLMTGADDYVTKPFSPAELMARVDALMRRSGGSMEEHSGEISQPPFLLNTRNRTLEKNGKPVKLTQVEYSICLLYTSAANIFAYPTTYVVDRNGNIVGDPIVGAITEKKQAEALQAQINKALSADMG